MNECGRERASGTYSGWRREVNTETGCGQTTRRNFWCDKHPR